MLGVNVLLFVDLRPTTPYGQIRVEASAAQADREPVPVADLPNASDATQSSPYVLDPIEDLALAALGFGPREPLRPDVETPPVLEPETKARPRKKRTAKPVARAPKPPSTRAAPAPESPVEDAGEDGWVIRR